jgi:cell division septation protein DedD
LGRPDTLGRVAETLQAAQSGESEPVPDAGAIPEEEKIRTMAGTQSGLAGGYVVQIASTPDRAYAQNLAATFVERGYQAYVTSAEVKGATYFRVRIGRFASLTEARQIVAQLAEKYAVSGFVAQVQ